MTDIQDLSIAAGNNQSTWPTGMQVNALDDAGRSTEALLARFSRDIGGVNVSTGTSTAYLLEPNRTFASLAAGIIVVWRAHTACGDSPTLDLDGLGAKSLVDQDNRNLAPGDIAANQMVVSIYNATNDKIECVTVKATLPTYAVASLPTGAAGQQAFATDGRKNGEGSGSGTGVMVFHDGTAWRACDTGATVAA